jgi:hypothetical protein
MKVKCVECKKTFNKFKSQIKKYPIHFCSRSCASKYKSRKRKIFITIKCLNCNKKLLVSPFEAKHRKFCDHFCAGKFINKGKLKKRICIQCGKHTSNKKYCSVKCQISYEGIEYIKKWEQGLVSGTGGDTTSKTLRRHLLEQAEYKCQECGWGKINPFSKTIPLHVDHLDGNSRNNKKGNHKVLCPSCHALTPNWGQLNKGKGRKSRKVGRPLKASKKEYKCMDCGKKISVGSKRCKPCDEKTRNRKRKVIRPEKDTLLKEVQDSNFTAVGRKYKVSDNTVRKWMGIKK